MSKQDRQGVRTAADVERKYSLGEIDNASKRSTKAEKQVSGLDQKMNLFMSSVNKTIEDLQNRINSFYPVGSIYLSLDDTDPAELFGGVWDRIAQGRTLWGADDSNYIAGNTLEAGLPNIEGSFNHPTWAAIDAPKGSVSGAFSWENGVTFKYTAMVENNRESTNFLFDASKSNGIYGNSETVRPPALVVYMWKRVS